MRRRISHRGNQFRVTAGEGIAAECGPDEVTEIHERMGALRSELNAVESWDGDTGDDIHRTLEFFAELLALKQGTSGHSPG